jgi:DNA-directed RNA polymerase specialized sigma24 family protein
MTARMADIYGCRPGCAWGVAACRVAERAEGLRVEPADRFTALYRAHYAAVLRYACRRADLEVARDVVAETFLVAWRRIASVAEGAAQALPWLYGVARLVLANSDRSRRRGEHLALRLVHAGEPGADPAPDLADAVAERARRRLIRRRSGSLAGKNSTSLAQRRRWAAPGRRWLSGCTGPAAGWPAPCPRSSRKPPGLGQPRLAGAGPAAGPHPAQEAR